MYLLQATTRQQSDAGLVPHSVNGLAFQIFSRLSNSLHEKDHSGDPGSNPGVGIDGLSFVHFPFFYFLFFIFLYV